MTGESTKARKKPRATDFLMLGLLGFTMFGVIGMFLDHDGLGVRVFCVAYFALGAFLFRRHWRSLP